MSTASALAPGLADPVFDSQRIFRTALEALSRPGRPLHLPTAPHAPPPLMAAGAAFLLAMADFETPLWLQHRTAALCEYLRFHCGALLVAEPRAARYALVSDPATMPALTLFDAGTAEYPDRSATLIVQVPRLSGGRRARLSGTGIVDPVYVEPSGLRPDFWAQWQRNARCFPCGVDVLFVCGRSIVGLPRTVKAEV